jgi:hypothetical protein
MAEKTKTQVILALSVTDRGTIASALRQTADAVDAGQNFDEPHPIKDATGATIGSWHVRTR